MAAKLHKKRDMAMFFDKYYSLFMQIYTLIIFEYA